MLRQRILQGAARSLWWVAGSSGRFHAKDYYDKLPQGEQRKLTALFEQVAGAGTILNRTRYRRESPNIHAFKSGKHRLYSFQEGRDVMLTNGYLKKTNNDKRLERALAMAERIRVEYLDQQREDHDGV
jgi:hypothetical protein